VRAVQVVCAGAAAHADSDDSALAEAALCDAVALSAQLCILDPHTSPVPAPHRHFLFTAVAHWRLQAGPAVAMVQRAAQRCAKMGWFRAWAACVDFALHFPAFGDVTALGAGFLAAAARNCVSAIVTVVSPF
jgi:hypothetical protein